MMFFNSFIAANNKNFRVQLTERLSCFLADNSLGDIDPQKLY